MMTKARHHEHGGVTATTKPRPARTHRQ